MGEPRGRPPAFVLLSTPEEVSDDVPTTLLKVFGNAFLRYVLAIPDAVDVIPGINSAPDMAVKNLYASALGVIKARSGIGVTDLDHVAGMLSIQIPGDSTSLVNTIRQYCGGQIAPSELTGDPLIDALSLLARDIWPVFLLPPPEDRFLSSWPPTFRGLFPMHHPQGQHAISAALKDPALGRVFSQGLSESDGHPSATLISSNGWAGTVYLEVFLARLVGLAVAQVALDCGNLDYPGICRRLAQVVDDAKMLAAGEEVDLTGIVGFRGWHYPSGVEALHPPQIRSTGYRPFDGASVGGPAEGIPTPRQAGAVGWVRQVLGQGGQVSGGGYRGRASGRSRGGLPWPAQAVVVVCPSGSPAGEHATQPGFALDVDVSCLICRASGGPPCQPGICGPCPTKRAEGRPTLSSSGLVAPAASGV